MAKTHTVLLVLLLIACSCKTSRQLAYFQDLPDTQATQVSTAPYQPLKLQANDEVRIFVSSASPEASQFFNLPAPSGSLPATLPGATVSNAGNLNGYRVSSNGLVTLPVLGDVPAAGKTSEELKADIIGRLKPYLKQPIVTVTLVNFKVTVIGEVNRPVVIPVNGETINVLEAIGASGDLTVFGIRKNVKVIRKTPSGVTQVAVLDFNNSNVMRSPYFQLRQNDIVYVQPNKSKGILGTRSNILVPIITSLVSIAAIIITRR